MRRMRSSAPGDQVSEDPEFTGMTTWQPWTSTPQTASFVLSGGDGLKTVYVRVRDASSHINGATTDDRNTITLDAAGPTFSSKVTINGGATTTTSTTVSVSINATDAGSSVAGDQVSEDPGIHGDDDMAALDLHAADGRTSCCPVGMGRRQCTCG